MAETIRAAQVRDRVIRTVAHHLGFAEDAVLTDKKLSELHPNHDSLDGVELTMDFEDEFDIVIDDADAEKLTSGTVGEMVAYFEKHPALTGGAA